MKRLAVFAVVLSFSLVAHAQLIVNHSCTNLDAIPADAIAQAKATLHIAYGHTSHGSQLITGMESLVGQTNLVGYKGDIYRFAAGGGENMLDLRDYYGSFPGGASDLGNPDFATWATATRSYLNNPDNTGINVIIWSWCGQVSWASEQDIDNYLSLMSDLEADFPNVKFVYMTGHRDYGADASLKANNQRIRDYCVQNGKTLFDFADIESYNPDGEYFEFASDDCSYYDAEGNALGNWAQEWQNSHTEGVDWYSCESAHSEPLNANRKAYAAWWLWARLGGWNPDESGLTFTTAPHGAWKERGESLELTVEVAGAVEPITYQWFKDNQELVGETSNVFAIEELTTDDEGWYKCRVTDGSKAVHETTPVFIKVVGVLPLGLCALAGISTIAGVLVLRRQTI